MTTAIMVCERCGTKILADAPEGLCTACLFEAGLDLLVDKPVAAVGDPGQPASIPTSRDYSESGKNVRRFWRL